MDFKTVLASLLKRFEERKIRYGLMGGFALGLWGAARATADLDFLVRREDMENVSQIMQELGYERKFTSENVSQFTSQLKPFGEVDYLHAFRQATVEMLDGAVEREIFNGGLKIKVLRPEHLIGLKLQAIRNDPSRKGQDLADIASLVAARENNLDWALIETYADVLGAQDLLKEIRGK